MPEHYSDVTLADIEKIINNGFVQFRAELLKPLIFFPGSQTNLE